MELIDDLLAEFMHGFVQVWIGRRVLGGTYVRMDGEWRAVYHFMSAPDGSRYFRYMVCDCNGSNSSFHETYNGIEAIEG